MCLGMMEKFFDIMNAESGSAASVYFGGLGKLVLFDPRIDGRLADGDNFQQIFEPDESNIGQGGLVCHV